MTGIVYDAQVILLLAVFQLKIQQVFTGTSLRKLTTGYDFARHVEVVLSEGLFQTFNLAEDVSSM